LTKYHAIRTNVDGVWFASKAEAARYEELLLLERGGIITGLILQPAFPIQIGTKKICKYIADFQYTLKDGSTVVEDVKGVKTPIYRLKKKLVEAVYPGTKITEVGK